MIGVGNRLVRYFDLPLIRYDSPSPPSISPPPPLPTDPLALKTNKPRAPVIRYNIAVPSTPVGPNDLVCTSLYLQPLDPNVAIRSASLIVERRIDLRACVPPSPITGGSASEPATPSSASASGSVTPPAFDSPYDDVPSPRTHLSPYTHSSINTPSPMPSPAHSLTTIDTSSTRPLLTHVRYYPPLPPPHQGTQAG